ncbi:hypothetical protein [Blastopirellula marina]|uniref:Uncharacterized protein n=1 Tax=Blastopirellula marina TaxID=124 RepID=A0A2S8GC13_9BACT|nr:hypothetical protein [Blastopirellula marina]PQO41987.1 hypothetical protein C5Y93_26885 [Blastopirellula marina]
MHEQMESRQNRLSFAWEIAQVLLGLALMLVIGRIIGYFALKFYFGISYERKEVLPFVGAGIVLLVVVFWTMTLIRYEYYRWRSTVVWFRIDGNQLEYRTAFARQTVQVPLETITWTYTQHPYSIFEVSSPTYFIQDADLRWIYLNPRLLHGAAELAQRLRKHAVKNRIDNLRANVTEEVIDPEHPLMPRVAPHLQQGEEVYWIGQVDFAKLLKTRKQLFLTAVVALSTLSVAAIVGFSLWFLWPSMPALPIAVLLLVAWFAALTEQSQLTGIQRNLEQSLYVVTSRRAIILDGFYWREGYCRFWFGDDFQAWNPTELLQYEYTTYGRDFYFGYRLTKQFRLQPTARWFQGFLAPDDREAAHLALIRLLDEHYAELFPDDTSST